MAPASQVGMVRRRAVTPSPPRTRCCAAGRAATWWDSAARLPLGTVFGFGPSLIDTIVDMHHLALSGTDSSNPPTAIDTHDLTDPTNWITTTVDGRQQSKCAAVTDDAIAQVEAGDPA